MGRGIARPMLAQTGGVMKRNYHEKVIDHYENPRNVCLTRGSTARGMSE